MCYHIEFSRSASKGVRINRRKLPKLGSAGVQTPAVGVAEHLEIRPSPRVILPNLVFLGQTSECNEGKD